MSYRQFLEVLLSFEVFADDLAGSNAEVLKPALLDEVERQREAIQSLRAALHREYIADGVDPAASEDPMAEIRRVPRLDAGFSCTPTFIIANARSGTTLVANLLHAGRHMVALPENFLVGALARADDKLFILRHLLRRSLGESSRVFLGRVAHLVDSIYQDYVQRQDDPQKRRWVSKELIVPDRLDVVDALFDYRAQYIYVVRHGFNVAHSCAVRFTVRGDALDDAWYFPYVGHRSTGLRLGAYLQEWILNSEATLDFVERNQHRCFLVRYEDLIQDPNRVMRRLFEFLGEPWEGDLLDRFRKRGPLAGAMGDNKIHGTRGQVDPRDVRHWESWPPELVAQLAKKANPTLQRLGYQAVSI